MRKTIRTEQPKQKESKRSVDKAKKTRLAEEREAHAPIRRDHEGVVGKRPQHMPSVFVSTSTFFLHPLKLI